MKIWHLVTIVPYILWSIISIKSIIKKGGFNKETLLKVCGTDAPTHIFFWLFITCVTFASLICHIGINVIDWNKELISLNNFR